MQQYCYLGTISSWGNSWGNYYILVECEDEVHSSMSTLRVTISSKNIFTLYNFTTPHNHVRNKKETWEAQMTCCCGGPF